MGILFDTNKKIYRRDFEKLLRSIPELSDIERSYIEGVFQDSLKDGLTKYELKKEISRLKNNPNDDIDSYEIKKIKNKLIEKL